MVIPIVTNYELWAVFGGHPTEKLYMQCLCIFKLWVNISFENQQGDSLLRSGRHWWRITAAAAELTSKKLKFPLKL